MATTRDPSLGIPKYGATGLYVEGSYYRWLESLTVKGGVRIYIWDTTNPHYTIKEDPSFVTVVYVALSQTKWVDIFPSFTFFASAPSLIKQSKECCTTNKAHYRLPSGS